MKIVITGSLGNISKPLTEVLIQNRHSITVITSNVDKQKEIEALRNNCSSSYGRIVKISKIYTITTL
jgi:NAD dependent epimerase/dehydratase family enzyme